jgi:hypothetical protein
MMCVSHLFQQVLWFAINLHPPISLLWSFNHRTVAFLSVFSAFTSVTTLLTVRSFLSINSASMSVSTLFCQVRASATSVAMLFVSCSRGNLARVLAIWFTTSDHLHLSVFFLKEEDNAHLERDKQLLGSANFLVSQLTLRHTEFSC